MLADHMSAVHAIGSTMSPKAASKQMSDSKVAVARELYTPNMDHKTFCLLLLFCISDPI